MAILNSVENHSYNQRGFGQFFSDKLDCYIMQVKNLKLCLQKKSNLFGNYQKSLN